MKSNLKRIFKFGVIPVFLIVIIYLAYSSYFNYWTGLFFVQVAPEVIPTQYQLLSAPATTTTLAFNGVELAVPWSETPLSKVQPSTAHWSFENDQQSLTIFFSTTTARSVWKQDPYLENILPLSTLSTYELDKIIWRIQKSDLPLWPTKNNNAVRNLMLAEIKTAKYSWCDGLLEFQNAHDIKGVICEWGSKEGEKKSIVYFYLGNDDSEYSFIIKPDQTRTQIRDSIIASIKKLE